jgi:UDP-N-acetylmuramoyl-L-alanyl-D-glutamate--2,6-diaminopimelate ligase
MTVRELLGEGPEVDVVALAYDNRAVTPGTLFFCVPGFTRDGHDFAADAVARGASALVVARPLGLGVPELLVDDVRAAMARAATRMHGDPTAELAVVGVTGTSGKTTTTHLVRHLLESARWQCALLGGVTTVIGGERRAAVRTTPEAIDLQAGFRAMLDAGDRACAMEVSSHALELRRVDGVRFAVAAFTNLSQDHLDFHPDMERYFAAKRRLFTELDVGRALVVIDDAWGRRLAGELDGAVTVSLEQPADWQAVQHCSGLGGNAFTVRSPAGEAAVELPLRGRFNAANALVALAAGDALGLELAQMAAALRTVVAVPGRVEAVEEGQGFALLVDYAHKPGALEKVLASGARAGVRPRDRGVRGGRRPRPRQAPRDGRDRGAARRPRDRDLRQPRSEPPRAIIDEILAGVPAGALHVEHEPDRRAAIARAVALAASGDVVLIAGKGHEQGQEHADGRIEPFDDVEEARAALRARVGAA